VFAVVETPTFQKQADKVWSAAQRHAFIDWIASNPTAGDVIAGADGARKVRWGAQGRGKRGGVRVIYFNLNAEGLLVLVAVYAKAERDNLPAHEIDRS
jgi:mRNA-degrading endonuclease RelE of RelBE toxin-antitoxin system